MFKPEISWLKNFGTKFGLDSELLDLIKDKFPEEFLEDVVQALIKSGDGYACYYYCRYAEDVREFFDNHFKLKVSFGVFYER